MSKSASTVIITDVTLREYGQNIPLYALSVFSPQIRIDLAQRLIRAGFKAIEVFSCVHPRIAPAMSKKLVGPIAENIGKVKSCDIITLVPNRAGYENFLALGLGPEGYNHSLGLFFSAVEEHNLLNLGKPILETLKECRRIAEDAASRNIRLVAYISAAFGFREPQAGQVIRVSPQRIASYLDLLLDLGACVVTLSDLQGVADQEDTQRLLADVLNLRKGKDIEKVAYHPHHVSGPKAVANSLAAYEIGLRRFDASLGGTGGCVTGAPGNQPTEFLVSSFERKGIRTGVNPGRVSSLAQWIQKELYRRIELPGGESHGPPASRR